MSVPAKKTQKIKKTEYLPHAVLQLPRFLQHQWHRRFVRRTGSAMSSLRAHLSVPAAVRVDAKLFMLVCLLPGVISSPSSPPEACPETGLGSCDSNWAAHGLNCSHLIARGWDCSGCDCPGDSPLKQELSTSSPPPAQPPTCPNTCVGAPEYANDGECDDGGPGSSNGVCAFGALCAGSNLSP